MIAQAGELALCLGALAAAWTVVASLAAWGLDSRRWLPRARAALGATGAAFGGGLVVLAAALARTDLRIEYVAGHSERELPLYLRLAALWAGQEGSLLLLGFLVAGVGSIAAAVRRRENERSEGVTLGFFGATNAFFAALLLFAADPFRLVGAVPADGYGLNPQLQHWAMLMHPPMLFTGYALFSVPCAIALGALAAKRTDREWVGDMRRWAVLAWLFLSAGIALGAYWAYAELGWGGYWAWDPVENASLMPWLTGTALVHTVTVHQRRGVLKRWTPGLAFASFILCILGTYITRSGVFQSVHAFGQSSVGNFFAGFLVALLAVAAIALWRGRRALTTENRVEDVLGREGTALLGNILLAAMAVTTLLGTLSPLLGSVVSDAPLSANQSFYNRTVAPLGLATASLMVLAPLLAYGRGAGAVLRRELRVPGAVGLTALGLGVIAGVRNPVALVCVGIAGVGIAAIVVGFAHTVRSHARRTGSGLASAAAQVLDADHRRYGGHLAHLGMILVILGVAGSSLFSVKRAGVLRPGDRIVVGSHVLRHDGLEEVITARYTGIRASISVSRAGREEFLVFPERRFHDRSRGTSAEVAIRTSWREDLYVALVGWEGADGTIALQVHVNPLTSWIWAGSVFVVAGGTVGVLPRLLPRAVGARAAGPAPVCPSMAHS